jgi:UPF0716 family protein affecting phage T7 exclusion
VFIVWKALGVLWTLAYVVFTSVFALPTAARLGYGTDLLVELGLAAAEMSCLSRNVTGPWLC